MAEATETGAPGVAKEKGPQEVSIKKTKDGVDISFLGMDGETPLYGSKQTINATIHFVNKSNPIDIINKKENITFTLDKKRFSTKLGNSDIPGTKLIKKYYVQVQIGTSEWSSESYWIADGAISFMIGKNHITLSGQNNRFSITETIYIGYDDIKLLVHKVSSIGGGEPLELPDTLPDGRRFDAFGHIEIRKFTIDKDQGTFELEILVVAGPELAGMIPGITLESVGLSIQRINPDAISPATTPPQLPEEEEGKTGGGEV